MKRSLLILYASLLTGIAFGQTDSASNQLTVDEAVQLALEQNYNIRVEAKEAEISANNVYPGNAGLLPTVQLQGGYQYSVNDLDLQIANFSNGERTVQSVGGENAATEVYQTSVGISYVLFDGFRGRYRLRQLETQSALSDIQLTAEIENTLSNVISAYVEASREQSNLNVSEQSILISQDRLQRAESSFSYGNANKLQVLQASVDLKNDSVVYRNNLLRLDNAKRNLNRWLGRDPDQEYSLANVLIVQEDLEYVPLAEEMRARNAQLRQARQSVDLAEQGLKIAQSDRYPQLSLNGSYSYYNEDNELGQVLFQERDGVSGGVSLTYDLFTGNRTNKNIQNAKIDREKSQLLVDQRELDLETELQNAYATYQNQKQQLAIEQSNLATFEQNFEKAQDDYRLGQISSTDLREAQQNLIEAKFRINNALFNTKLAEIQLLHLSGRLAP